MFISNLRPVLTKVGHTYLMLELPILFPTASVINITMVGAIMYHESRDLFRAQDLDYRFLLFLCPGHAAVCMAIFIYRDLCSGLL